VENSPPNSPFSDPGALVDPYPVIQKLREDEPVYWDGPEDWWLLTRHQDVTAALQDERFSAEVGTPSVDLLPVGERSEFARLKGVLSRMPLFTEPPYHTRIRDELRPAFTTRKMQGMAEGLRRKAALLAAECDAAPRFDALYDFAEPLATAAFAEIMGLGEDELPQLRRISADLIGAFGGNVDIGRVRQAQQGVDELTDVLRRLAGDPGATGVMSTLADAMAAGRLTEVEAVAGFAQLLTGSLDPTPQTLAAAVLLMMHNPEQRRKLEADPKLVSGAVEEALRLEPPFPLIHRIITRDVHFGERTLAAGDHVALLLGGANRDPGVFADPDRFFVDRSPNRHLSFGVGHHFCLGGGLVRLMTHAGIEALLPLLGRSRLAGETPEYLPLMGIRKLKTGPCLVPAG
jgi:pimeloyl-[acyl-carrier protein] synthase